MRPYRMALKLFAVMVVGLMIGGISACGSSSGTDTDVSSARLISGEVTTDSALSISKAVAATTDGSAADVTNVRAMNSAGDAVNGAFYRETNRWEIQLQAGEWMIGFFDSSDRPIGYLEVEGATAFQIESGNALDLGNVLLANGSAVMIEDIQGLGEQGFRSMYGQDDDFDGIMNGFEDEIAYDPNIFSVIKAKPFDGQQHVAPCRPLKLYFSQPVDEASVTEETLLVTDADGAAVAGTLSYEVDDLEEGEVPEYEIKFEPAGGYAMGSVINVLATTGTLNSDGVALDKEYAFSFTVRDFGGTSQVCHDMDGEYRQMERERHQGEEQQNQEQHQNGMLGGSGGTEAGSE